MADLASPCLLVGDAAAGMACRAARDDRVTETDLDARYLLRAGWRRLADGAETGPGTALRPALPASAGRATWRGRIDLGGTGLTWRRCAKPTAISIRAVGPFDLGRLSRLHKSCFEEAWSRSDLAHLLAMPGGFGLIARLSDGGLARFDALRGVGFSLCRVVRDESELLSIGVASPPIAGAASPAISCVPAWSAHA